MIIHVLININVNIAIKYTVYQVSNYSLTWRCPEDHPVLYNRPMDKTQSVMLERGHINLSMYSVANPF
jgi:hypothetical protein